MLVKIIGDETPLTRRHPLKAFPSLRADTLGHVTQQAVFLMKKRKKGTIIAHVIF
jgi:hypothetical protein